MEQAITANATAASAAGIFAIEQQNDTLIVVPVVDLRELVYHRIEAGAREIVELLNGSRITNVMIDYLGSAVPGPFVVGHGINWAGCYRQLPSLGYLPPGETPHGEHEGP